MREETQELDEPATLRDVLMARNLVIRHVTVAAHVVAGLVLVVGMILVLQSLPKSITDSSLTYWGLIVGAASFGYYMDKHLLKLPKDVLRMEKLMGYTHRADED